MRYKAVIGHVRRCEKVPTRNSERVGTQEIRNKIHTRKAGRVKKSKTARKALS